MEYAAAFALALSGDCLRIASLAEDLAKRFPEDTPVQFEYLPTLRALFALSKKRRSTASSTYKTALPYDLAMPGTAFFAKFGGLYPVYVRGQAYLAGRAWPGGGGGIPESPGPSRHRACGSDWRAGAPAIGESTRYIGRRDRARSAYQNFLTLWKDADTDLPVLKQASAEYAKL